MNQKDLLYVPPEVREGVLLSGVTVDEVQIVKGVKWTAPKSSQGLVLSVQAEAPETRVESGLIDESGRIDEGGERDEEVGNGSGVATNARQWIRPCLSTRP